MFHVKQFELALKIHLLLDDCVVPPKRDFTSVSMNSKEFIKPLQNAHMKRVEPVCPLTRWPVINR